MQWHIKYDPDMEALLEAQITDEYMPVALDRKPVLLEYDSKVLQQYLGVCELRAEGFNGYGKITLREIDLHLAYYPVDDVYYFIDLMREIDRCQRERNNSSSKN